MSWTKIACLFSFCALLAAPVMAQPTLEFRDAGLNGSNRIFNVYVTPDPALYSVDTNSDTVNDASSIAVELGMSSNNPMGGAIPGIVPGSATVTADFQDDNVAPLGNNGYDPFQSGAIVEGVVEEASGTDLFAALGSTGDISQPLVGLLSGRTLVMSFEVDADISVIDVLGWDEDSSSVVGAQIAQDGVAYDVTGSFGINGDYQPNGNVDIVDFGIFGAAFGNPAASFPESDFNFVGANIDIVDFGIFGANFGLSMPTSGSVSASVVPEPSSMILLGLAGLAGIAVARRR